MYPSQTVSESGVISNGFYYIKGLPYPANTVGMTIKPILSALLLVNALFAAAGTATASSSELRKVLQITGITPQIHQLEGLVADAARSNAARCGIAPPGNSIPSFSAESIIFDTVSHFNHPDSLDISSLLTWFDSPLAKKIHKAELSDVPRKEFVNYVKQIKRNPQRLQRIENIVSNTRTVEYIVTVGTEIEYAGILHSGCIANQELKTPGKKNRERQLADVTRSDKELTAKLIGTDITLELAYLLRNLTSSELREYEAFTASPNAGMFYPTLITAVEQSYGLASDRIPESYSVTSSSIDF